MEEQKPSYLLVDGFNFYFICTVLLKSLQILPEGPDYCRDFV